MQDELKMLDPDKVTVNVALNWYDGLIQATGMYEDKPVYIVAKGEDWFDDDIRNYDVYEITTEEELTLVSGELDWEFHLGRTPMGTVTEPNGWGL